MLKENEIQTSYVFEWNCGGRDDENKNNPYLNDCVIRTFVLAFEISYQEAKDLCINNRMFEYEKYPITEGVGDWTIYRIFKLNNWDYIEGLSQKELSLNKLLFEFPQLKTEKFVAVTSGHIFYVDEGTIKDRWDDGFSNIETILSPINRKHQIEEIIKCQE